MLGAFSQIPAAKPLFISLPSSSTSFCPLSSPSRSRATLNPSPQRLPLASRIIVRTTSQPIDRSLIVVESLPGIVQIVEIMCSCKEVRGCSCVKHGQASGVDVGCGSKLGDLSYSTSEASLIKLFSRFGHIIDVRLPRHEESNHSKGYAFIQYCSQEEAILAVEEIDHKWINGRIVYAEIAKPLYGGFIAYPKTSGPPLPQISVSNKRN